jgi:hypothetical protein
LRLRNRQPLRPRSYRHRRRISDRARNLLGRIHASYAAKLINARRRRTATSREITRLGLSSENLIVNGVPELVHGFGVQGISSSKGCRR